MGYTTRCVNHHRVSKIILTGVKTEEKKKTLLPLNKENAPHGISYPEFRTAVLLSLPAMNKTSKVSYDKQLSVDAINVKSKSSVDSYTSQLIHVNALNQAFAAHTSLYVKGTKTKVAHYEIDRNSLIKGTANSPLTDADGNVYARVEEIPEHMLDYLRKKFHYPKRETKRKAEDVDPSPTDNDKPVSKKRKSKAKAVEAAVEAAHKAVSMEVDTSPFADTVDWTRWKPEFKQHLDRINDSIDLTFLNSLDNEKVAEFLVRMIAREPGLIDGQALLEDSAFEGFRRHLAKGNLGGSEKALFEQLYADEGN
jgi:hypothetical protein